MNTLTIKIVDEQGRELFSQAAPFEDRKEWLRLMDDMTTVVDDYYAWQE